MGRIGSAVQVWFEAWSMCLATYIGVTYVLSQIVPLLFSCCFGRCLSVGVKGTTHLTNRGDLHGLMPGVIWSVCWMIGSVSKADQTNRTKLKQHLPHVRLNRSVLILLFHVLSATTTTTIFSVPRTHLPIPWVHHHSESLTPRNMTPARDSRRLGQGTRLQCAVPISRARQALANFVVIPDSASR